MLAVGHPFGEPVTALLAVAASQECLESAWGPPSSIVLVLPSLLSVSFLLPALSSNNTMLGRDVRNVWGQSQKKSRWKRRPY